MVVMVFAAFTTSAQEKETPYWYVSSYKVPWAKTDSLKTLVTMYTNPIVAQAKKMGRILDYHLLIHHTGGEYNVVIMVKYPSWTAIGKGAGFADAFKVIESNEAKRNAAIGSFNWVFEGSGSVHMDNIYTEATQ